MGNMMMMMMCRVQDAAVHKRQRCMHAQPARLHGMQGSDIPVCFSVRASKCGTLYASY
jgi:hypothetical protein